jgi:DNA topoisomerase-1
MKLVIVESPTKTKTVSKYLGKEYEVHASVGHVRDLPKSNKKAIDIEGGFVPHYEIAKGKEKVIADIKKRAAKAEEVILATDPDREGESIAWHIKEACGLKNPKRIVFYEITEPAVKEALEHPREIDENLRRAQEARRVLDRIVGYDLSGLIWKKVRYGLSAGRVQSPALRILMEKEREVRAFKSEAFWVISGDFTAKKEKMTLTCEEEPRDHAEVERIISAAKKHPWQVTDVKKTEVKRSPRAPFTTSTLQQSASSLLGISPSQTMRIAQKLYEQGLITYMRTDSPAISKTALPSIYGLIEKTYGKEFVAPRTYAAKSKNAQEAHESVRPTDIKKKSAGATDEQKRLYKLIWERTVASQMSDAKILRTKVSANISGETIPDFSANGNILVFEGWLTADSFAKNEAVILPDVKPGDSITLADISEEAKETQPPGRYSEAGLIKELEKRGIGRPSTYASIIKTLVDRGYVEKIQRALVPTDTGEVVNNFLEEHFPSYISDTFTAEMEDELDEIADGKRDYLKSLSDFYKPFQKDVKSKEKLDKATNLGDAPAEFKCPVCGADMIVKLGRTGKFLSCKRFPDCQGARKFDGSEMEPPKETGEMCPKCEKGKLIEREGRFGKFISCDRYPKCKYIKESPEEEAKRKTGVACPECKTGEIVERKGRFGFFYSCSNYPACKFIMKSKPTGKTCSECGALMMEGTKTIPERCSNKSCPNHNPHKKEKK